MRPSHRLYMPALFALAFSAILPAGCLGKRSPAAPPTDPHKLVITKAVWGVANGGPSVDVTKRIADLVKGNALSVEAHVHVLGEPADFKIKELTVEYTKGGLAAHKRVPEGETLTIGPDEKPAPVRLVVRKAVYGNLPDGRTVDVTQKVAYMVTDNTLSVTPTNDLFGDPAEAQFKQLRVDYTFDDKALSKSVNEKESLTISANGQ